jgi:hypothetical protein
MQMIKKDLKPQIPFKFNLAWLEEEEFSNIIKYVWKPCDNSLKESTCVQFSLNIKTIKKGVSTWAHEKRLKEDQFLASIE